MKPMVKAQAVIEDPPSDFGIKLMEGEEVIISLRPEGFVRYAVIAPAMTIVGLLFVPLAFLWALIAERRYHYWLTNRRVMWCHGFIGYQVRSVPLERIADVVISRTFPEMVAGITSIDIRDMTGQTFSRGGGGAKWIGVKDAPEVQKRILEEVQRVNSLSRSI